MATYNEKPIDRFMTNAERERISVALLRYRMAEAQLHVAIFEARERAKRRASKHQG